MGTDANDSAWFKAFKEDMTILRLPCPETLFGSITLAAGTLKAMADTVKTLGTKVTLRELILAFPIGGTAAAMSTACVEVGVAALGMTAAFYLGACVGCMLNATFEVYGVRGVAKLGMELRHVERKLGSLWQLLVNTAVNYPLMRMYLRQGSYLGMAGLATR